MSDESRNRSGSEAERWKQIDRILEQALERETGERASFLDKACGGDAKLRAELEELLAAHERAGSFLDAPAVEVAAKGMAKDRAGLLVGRQVGPYKIQALLGAGGMGEVYRARDTRLERTIAIKILPPEFASDEERMRRFRREAKAASALNHPNVATIYDVGDSEGVHYIAMEHVEGKTLDALIGRRGMRLNDALKYGVQIADALAAAHEAGIVHRDLKPGNLMVTAKGQVKVLDFGLAKLRERVSLNQEGLSTAATQPTTEEGKIVGTVAYMSPEQAEGKPVDARSDIFSFGSVLYEMVTGRRAFQGDTPSSTLAAILKDNPRPPSEVVATLPKEVERLISRCLRKDVDHRFQHMADVKIMLEELKEESDSGALEASGAPEAAGHGKLRWAAVLAGMSVIVVALGIGAWFWLGRSRPAADESLPTAVPLTTYPGTETYPSFSADGTQVAFQWCPEGWGPGKNCDIYVKQIGVDPPSRLTDTQEQEFGPAWSPDGRFIAFLRKHTNTRVALILIPQRGGRERVLAELDFSRASDLLDGPYLAWTPDSKWIVTPVPEAGWTFYLFSVETGEKRRLTDTPAQIADDIAPAFSPDGGILAFARKSAVSSDLCILRLGDGYRPRGEVERVPSENPYNIGVAWTPDGSEIVFSSGDVSSMDLWRTAPAASAKARRLPFASGNARAPAMSRQGNRLVYVVERSDTNIWRVDLRGPDRKPGVPVQLISSTRSEHNPSFSPDGKRIAFRSNRSGANEIWLCDSDGSNPVQLTSLRESAELPGAPRWSPDGQSIAFSRIVGGNQDLYVISVNGGALRRLTTDPAADQQPCWSQDGKSIYFRSNRGGTAEIWRMPAIGGNAVQITRDAGADLPHESPDGRFVYYSKGWPNAQSVWRVAVEGGEATKILDGVHPEAFWTVATDGIYFFTKPDEKGHSELSVHELATAKTRKIMTIERSVTWCIETSRDGRTILYTQRDEVGSDLMLVENFR